jgi:hypothetical protein
MFEETREYVKKLGLPSGDLFDMPSSPLRFPDGAAFRIEVPTINSAESVGSLLDTAEKNGITINRVTETYGMFRHTREEIKEYCRLCHDYGAELLMRLPALVQPIIRRNRPFSSRRSDKHRLREYGTSVARSGRRKDADMTWAYGAS